MSNDVEKEIEGWGAKAWAWIKSRPANFLYGAAAGFLIGAILF